MKQIFILALFGLTVVTPLTVGRADAQSVAAQPVAADRTVTFTVENMTCALCPVTVKRAMEGVDGVRTVEIDLAARTATVLFDTESTNVEGIAAASANAGYPAQQAES